MNYAKMLDEIAQKFPEAANAIDEIQSIIAEDEEPDMELEKEEPVLTMAEEEEDEDELGY